MSRIFDVYFDLRVKKLLSGEAGDFRRYRAHYDVIVMEKRDGMAVNVGIPKQKEQNFPNVRIHQTQHFR